MQLVKSVGLVFVAGFLLACLPGCEKKEGPAEHAGKAVDNAVDSVGKKIEKTGDNIQDAAKGEKK